jgi:hypothetical protein
MGAAKLAVRGTRAGDFDASRSGAWLCLEIGSGEDVKMIYI